MIRNSIVLAKNKGLTKLQEKLFIHLPQDGNEKDFILSAQLLVEELIVILNDQKVIESSKRLTFHNKLLLLKEVYSTEFESWLYESCRKLNLLRNQYSHVLEPENYDHAIDDFVSLAYELDENVENEVNRHLMCLEKSLDKDDSSSNELISMQNYHYTVTKRMPLAVDRILTVLIEKVESMP